MVVSFFLFEMFSQNVGVAIIHWFIAILWFCAISDIFFFFFVLTKCKLLTKLSSFLMWASEVCFEKAAVRGWQQGSALLQEAEGQQCSVGVAALAAELSALNRSECQGWVNSQGGSGHGFCFDHPSGKKKKKKHGRRPLTELKGRAGRDLRPRRAKGRRAHVKLRAIKRAGHC